jgi:hypothetical protein
MARKAKKKLHQMPPLSFADMVIYWSIMVILIALYIGLLVGPLLLRGEIAFAEESVMAARGTAAILWMLVPWMTFFLMSFILWVTPYQARRPIFGRRNFKYGPPAWPKIYPVFMKAKPYVWVSERTKKNRKTIALVLAIVLLVSFIPLPWSLYDRECLRSDGSIVRYNVFNRESREHSSGQVAAVEFETHSYSTGKSSIRRRWGVMVTLVTDSGRRYVFNHREFRTVDGESRYWVEAMLQLKRRYDPAIITYTGADKLTRVAEDQRLTAGELQRLRQLFEMT